MKDHKHWVSEVFDRAAPEYGKKSSSFFSYFGKRLVEHASLRPGQMVLDVATGKGAVLFPIAEEVGPLGKVVGIDISPKMVEMTSQEAQDRKLHWVELHCMDAERLNFPDNYFDFIFCGFGLFFLPSISSALSEFKRVLKIGGTVMVSTWGKFSNLFSLVDEEIKKFPHVQSLIATPLWNESDLFKVLQEADFEKIKVFNEKSRFIHKTAEEWWESLWSHATRAKLEQLESDQVANIRKKVLAKAYDLDEGQGLFEDQEVLYGIAQKS